MIDEYNKAYKVLIDRICKVIDELDSINNEFASWDDWEKTKIIDKSRNALCSGFEKEIFEKEKRLKS